MKFYGQDVYEFVSITSFPFLGKDAVIGITFGTLGEILKKWVILMFIIIYC